MKLAGVYEIINLANGHRYVGSTDNMRNRWRLHMSELAKGTHHSVYLQRAWNKYGEQSFQFNVLYEIESKDERLAKEQELLDVSNPQYNICPKATSRLGAKTNLITVEKLRKIGADLTPERRAEMRQNMLTKVIPAAAEWHKSDSGNEWHKQHYQNMSHVLHAKQSLICDQCGKEFVAEKGRFCSNACKSKWRRDNHLDDIANKCVICGNEFLSNKYANTKTCSRSCASKLLWITYREKGIIHV